MALIIPEAQTPFSLAEQPRLPQGMANGAEGIGTLADVGIQIKARKVKAEQDRILRTARLTAMDQMDQLRQTYENDPSLDGLGDRWQADATELTASIAKNLPANLQKDFTLSMHEILPPQTSAIRRREDALFKDAETAALNADLRGYEKAAANAPTEDARDAIYREAAGAIGAAVDGGYLSRVEADKIMADIPAGTEKLVAQRLLEEDPGALLEWLEAGEGSFLDPQSALIFARSARADLAAAEAKRDRETALAEKVADKELGSATDRAINILRDGLPYKSIADLLERTHGTPHGERLQSELDAFEKNAGFALQSPAQQRVEIERLRALPTDDPVVADNLSRLEAIATKTAASLKADSLQHVATRGIMSIEPVDITEPASVQARRAEAETVHRQFTPDATEIRYLDQAETDRLAHIVSGPDVNQALGIITAITENFAEAAPQVLAQIGAKDRIAQLSGVLVMETDDISAARAMLRGRAVLAEGKGVKASAEMRRTALADLATVFPTPHDLRLQTLFEAADAHYAVTGIVVADPKSPQAKETYTKSLNAVAGQTRRGDQVFGGFQTVNENLTLLPPALTATEVETAIVSHGSKAWARASLSGNLPRGFENYGEGDREDWTLLSLADGSYALGYRQRSGEIVYLQDDAQGDGIFRLDLNTLVTGGKD